MPASLHAIDTLRLEAGLCSKGKELHEAVNPVEASLGWTIASRRRREGGFLGAENLLTDSGKLRKVMRTCVGIACLSQLLDVSAEIYDSKGCIRIGEVTSAALSPCLKTPIAMAYVGKEFSKPGTDIMVKAMNGHKMYAAQVVKTPFVPTRFHKIRDPATGEEFEAPRIEASNDESKIQQHHVNDVDPMMEEHDSLTGEDLEASSSMDEFESPRSVARLFCDTARISMMVALPKNASNNTQKTIRDPSTGEVFECTP